MTSRSPVVTEKGKVLIAAWRHVSVPWMEEQVAAIEAEAAANERLRLLDELEGLRELSEAATVEQAVEDKVRSRKGRFQPSFFDTTARHAFQVAAIDLARALLQDDKEAGGG